MELHKQLIGFHLALTKVVCVSFFPGLITLLEASEAELLIEQEVL